MLRYCSFLSDIRARKGGRLRQSNVSARLRKGFADLLAVGCLLVGLAACEAGLTHPLPRLEVATQAAAPDDGTPAPCAAALIRGALVADEQWGVALIEEGNRLKRQVIWPAGFYAVIDGPGVAVMSPANELVAHTGDSVEIGGGESGVGGAWRVCGGIRVLQD